MASPLHPQPPWTSTLKTPNPFSSAKYLPKTPPFKVLIRLSSSSNPSNSDDSSSLDSEQNQDDSKNDRVSLAFSRALDYKKSLRLNTVQKSGEFQADSEVRAGTKAGILGFRSDDGEAEQKTVSESVRSVVQKSTGMEKSKGDSVEKDQESAGENGDGKDEIPEAVRVAMEKAKEYKKNKGTVSINERSKMDEELPGENGDGKDEIPEAIRVAMEKAKEYRKNKGTVSSYESSKMDEKLPGDENGNGDVSEAYLIAMEKAKEYKKNKGSVSSGESNAGNEKLPGPSKERNNDGARDLKYYFGKKELKISKIDFIGLDFSDKKERRGLPPGLVPAPDPYLGKDLPEVEFLVGDASKFEIDTSSEVETTQEDTLDLYKPKVSTWGVFPRPNNISKTFGGGKNIRPGEELESEEVKAAKAAHTKELLAAYKAQLGLNISPKLKAECGKALEDGNELMDAGKLKDALPYYQQVMEKIPFKSELHGLAALQWAICLDSLSRSDEAQVMYKKLQSHPNALVSKKARQFSFSFEAMDMMKVRRSPPRNPGYQTYFDAFVRDKPKYAPQESEPEEGALSEALPYIVFLVLPVLLVLLIAAKHGV